MNGLFPALALSVLLFHPGVFAADILPHPVSALASTMLERARNEVARIEPLVADGTLPKSSLEEAKTRLADAEDEEILAETLYGEIHIQDMTDTAAAQMMNAAQRRVNRQQAIVDQRETLLESGIIARSEIAQFQDELESRKRVLDLARNRVQLKDELRQMAETEQQLARSLQSSGRAATAKGAMIRYDGNGLFTLNDLPVIATEFEKHFHSALPVSALGQTLVHQSMGLDHRNRVDIALNPDSPEGVWLRELLEKLHVPYLAFRTALAGAATAPHIHIGQGSTRLKLASR